MAEAAHMPSSVADLYEADLYLWTEQQAVVLRTGRWSEVDTIHVAEEIEGVGGAQKSEIRSRLVIPLLHLLKWQLRPEKRKYGRRATIIEQRIQFEDLIEVSPSLRSWPDAVLARAYRLAVTGAAGETGLPESVFPSVCPDTIARILDLSFYPGPPEIEVV